MAETNAQSTDQPADNDIARDRYLVEQFNRGDGSAFDKIIEEHSADIAALANRLLSWPGEVDDVVQDIFLSAYMGLKKFRCQSTLKTWLFTITINKCRTYRYKRFLRTKNFGKITAETSPAQTPPADNAIMNREKFEQIRLAVSALPAKYREAIVLRYLNEFPINRISRILGVSENVVHVRLNRAKEKLKIDLAEFIED